jgi:hypothetical protein
MSALNWKLWLYRLSHLNDEPTSEEKLRAMYHLGQQSAQQAQPPVWPRTCTPSIAPTATHANVVLHWPVGEWRRAYFMAHPEQYRPRLSVQHSTPIRDLSDLSDAPTLHAVESVHETLQPDEDDSWLVASIPSCALDELAELASQEPNDDTAKVPAIMPIKIAERAATRRARYNLPEVAQGESA